MADGIFGYGPVENEPYAPAGGTGSAQSFEQAYGYGMFGAPQVQPFKAPALKQPAMPKLTPLDPAALYKQYQGIFGPPNPLDPTKIATQVGGYFKNIPTVTAPHVNPAQITLPGGTIDKYRDALYKAQFGPVQQEIGRQEEQASTALKGELAGAGLADSGSGVGQQELQRQNFDTYLQQQSANISASATATASAAELQVLASNAQLQQQASLANAGFDLAAQEVNAQNLLQGDTASAQGYLAALGINAQQAMAYRQSFNQFLGIEGERALAQDKFKLDSASMMFNFQLQSRAMDMKAWEAQQELNLQAYRNSLDANKILRDSQTAANNIRSGGGPNITGARQAAGAGAGAPTAQGQVGGNFGTNNPIDMGTAYAQNNPNPYANPFLYGSGVPNLSPGPSQEYGTPFGQYPEGTTVSPSDATAGL